jgi:hypothetical protein
MLQKLYGEHWCGVRVQQLIESNLGSSRFKNRDKLIAFTSVVSKSAIYFVKQDLS